MRCLLWTLALLATLSTAATAQTESDPDEAILQAAGLPTDGPGVLEFLRLRARLAPERERLAELLKQLADPSNEVHGKAAAELVSIGPGAVPALRHATNDLDDLGRGDRARKCLALIEAPHGPNLPIAAARLIAVRKPAGAVAALLAYLPFADDPPVTEAVAGALATLAYASGSADPALLEALASPIPVQRAAAADALSRADRPEVRAALRKLLSDPKPVVRLRAGLALAGQDDAEAFPVLIALLAELPAVLRKPAEDLLQQLAGEWSPNPSGTADDEVARKVRRDAWAAWWNNVDGPALLKEFRVRTLDAAEVARVSALIQQLGDDAFKVRERATNDLVAFGWRAVPLLKQAARGGDPERARRAEMGLRRITSGEAKRLPAGAARLLALRRPEGAAAALLDYLPFAEDETLAGEAIAALGSLARGSDGAPEPALLRALSDANPVRRSAAAEALGRSGGTASIAAIGKLLADTDAGVRMKAALTLASAGDKAAVPVLIGAMAESPSETAGQAHEALVQLAGEKAPPVGPGGDAAARAKAREAWLAWWRTAEPTFDPVALRGTQRLLGYLLLVQVDDSGNNGRVSELDRNGKVRWKIEGLRYPVDAWVLRGDRVLIAEYNGHAVTERDFKGKILWEKKGLTGLPVNAQRLANGNTFIATSNEFLEVDRTGKVTLQKQIPGGVTAAYKMANGQIVALTNNGQCVRCDATGKELKSFVSGRDSSWTSGIDVLPNGHVLVSQPSRNKVALLDGEGKTVWEADAPQITTATRLTNGNTLIASHTNRTVVELDRNGKVVKEHKDEFHIFRARKR